MTKVLSQRFVKPYKQSSKLPKIHKNYFISTKDEFKEARDKIAWYKLIEQATNGLFDLLTKQYSHKVKYFFKIKLAQHFYDQLYRMKFMVSAQTLRGLNENPKEAQPLGDNVAIQVGLDMFTIDDWVNGHKFKSIFHNAVIFVKVIEKYCQVNGIPTYNPDIETMFSPVEFVNEIYPTYLVEEKKMNPKEDAGKIQLFQSRIDKIVHLVQRSALEIDKLFGQRVPAPKVKFVIYEGKPIVHIYCESNI